MGTRVPQPCRPCGELECPPCAGRRGWCTACGVPARLMVPCQQLPAPPARLTCHEFQPQTFPGNPSKEASRPGAPPGLHVALGCQAAVSGPRGWPGAASSVWFSPSCPGITSDARLAVGARSWEKHKALYSWAQKEPLMRQTCNLQRGPGAPHHAHPPPRPLHSTGAPAGLLTGPQSSSLLPSEPASRAGQAEDPGLTRGTYPRETHSQAHVPKNTRDQPGHTCAHACARIPSVLSQSSLGTWAQGPGSPAQQALPGG